MKIKVSRFDKSRDNSSFFEEFEVEENRTLLANLKEIKTKKDNSLTYRCGCKSGVCGSCAVRVDGVERLACKTIVKDGSQIEPLKYEENIKDLVVRTAKISDTLTRSKASLDTLDTTKVVTKDDEKKIDVQSNCILCESCYSSCPVFEVNKEFLGPFALTRVLRYVNDVKEGDSSSKIEAIQNSGVWDCTLCGNCTMVCPQMIDPKTDIMNLQMKSAQLGFTNPNLQNFNDGFNSGFDSGFDTGFNPSGGFNPNGF